MSQAVLSELAPTGVLRAAINMGNFLLVTGRTPSGDPDGVSPDMARAIADKLGVPVKYVPFDFCTWSSTARSGVRRFSPKIRSP